MPGPARIAQGLKECLVRLGTEAVHDQRYPNAAPRGFHQRIAHLPAGSILGENIETQPHGLARAIDQSEQPFQPVAARRVKGQVLPLRRDGKGRHFGKDRLSRCGLPR